VRKNLISLTLGFLFGGVLFVGAQTIGVGRFSLLRIGATTQNTRVRAGAGTPEAAVTGAVGDVFLRTDGSTGTAMYVKETGSGNTGWAAPGGGGVTASSTNTFTNKTLDASATGNVVTLPFSTWLRAGRCDNATASSPEWSIPSSLPAVAACATGSNTQIGTLDYADGSLLSASAIFRLPSDISGTLSFNVIWYASPTTGDVFWILNAACVTDATQTIDQAYSVLSQGAKTTNGTTNRITLSSFAGITNTCAGGSTWFLQLQRDGARGSDTMTGTARLVGIEILTSRTM
jgi:hypothetical protein